MFLSLEWLEEVWTLRLELLRLRLSLLSSLLSKQVEQVQLRGRLVEDSWLDSKSIVWSVEVNSSNLWGLDTSSQLGSGHSLAVLAAESKTSLEARRDGVGVTVVDSAGHKSSNTTVTVTIKLDSTSEGCTQALAIAHLCGHAKLGHKLTIGVKGSSKRGSEAEVTVASKQTSTGGHSAHSSEASSCKGVLEALVLVGGWQEARRQEPGVGLTCRLGRQSSGGSSAWL